ncbi:hypothetical protein EDB19DRAFT_1741513 [Suillus lakei]|nr:hypothetical protein EDB19DRAFT_1741513 [Suillus lakei]
MQGGIHPGKASVQQKRVYISYNYHEIVISDGYEFLVGDENSVRWHLVNGPLSAEKLGGAIAVGGGMEAGGAPLYIAQAAIGGGIHCGKVKDTGFADIPYNGSEIIAESYNVLVFS